MNIGNDGRLSRQNANDFAEIIKRPEGMRFMSWLIELCGVNMLSFDPGACDVNATLFFEGRRSIGLRLLSMVFETGAGEGDYNKAVMERNELRRQDARDMEKGVEEYGYGTDEITGNY